MMGAFRDPPARPVRRIVTSTNLREFELKIQGLLDDGFRVENVSIAMSSHADRIGLSREFERYVAILMRDI